jgi:hypothetical protein
MHKERYSPTLNLGGTTDKNIYHYVYKVTDKKFLGTSTTYIEETVDFASATETSLHICSRWT